MKVYLTLVAIAGLASVAFAQEDPGPSPTNSVGCQPHGDHWHCDGPIATPVPVATTAVTSAASTTPSTEAHEHDHEHETEHEDEHDHEHEHDHEDEVPDHTSGSGTLPPAPTESVGCEPHEDHWHCDGPANITTGTTKTTPSIAPSPTESVGCETHGDHWHCDAPAVTSSSITSVAANRTIPAASTGAPSTTSTLVPANGAAAQGTGHGFVAALLVLAGVFTL